jgi:hypothetical protein
MRRKGIDSLYVGTFPWVRVILVGGLLFGLPLAITFASWNDREYAKGTFTGSTFDTESNVSGTGYVDNHVSPGTAVTFTGPGFAPGVSSYFSVLIRTKTGSVAGITTLGPGVLTGTDAATLGTALVYRVVNTTNTCGATAFTGSPNFVVGGVSTFLPLTTGQSGTVTNVLAAATPSSPGLPTGFCFEITLPANAANSLQNKSAIATWQFVGTSS